MDIDKKLYGAGFFGTSMSPKKNIMQEKFIIPPFSVLDARQGIWTSRKKAWVKLGLKGEEGRARDEKDTMNRAYRKTLDGHGRRLRDQFVKREINAKTGVNVDTGLSYDPDGPGTGVSIFDPVLTELCYRWFCPKGGKILDPFAGGATRGIVAGVLGYEYIGVEVRGVQVEANWQQFNDIGADVAPHWILGDSTELIAAVSGSGYGDFNFDLVFACPPYFDLELYSHDNRDGSTHKTYEGFLAWYKHVFAQTVTLLDNNRFLVVVVGEIRDSKGAYRNFVGDTIRIFKDELGLVYYNEMILVTRTGSLPMRAGQYFNAARKVGKGHQQVLCFYKGNAEDVQKHFRDAVV